MTFKDYLSTLKAGQDEKGDFLRLANADVHFPEVGTWSEFHAYFASRHNRNVADAGADLWKRYQAAERKERDA